MPVKSKKNIHNKKKQIKHKKRTKKQKGGVSFNAPINLDNVSSYTYPYNMRLDDPQDPSNVIDSRILNCSTAANASIWGGKKKSKRKVSKKKTIKRRHKKQKGGSNPLSYSYITGVDTCTNNDVLAFGSSGGSEYIKNTVLAEAPNCHALTSSFSITTLA